MIGVATAPPAVITNHCQSEPQPSSGSLPPVNKSKTVSAGTTALATVPEHDLRKRKSAQDQLALRIESRKPTTNSGKMVTPSGLAESASNHNPPQTASKATMAMFAFNAA